jgi:hypothetical protein
MVIGVRGHLLSTRCFGDSVSDTSASNSRARVIAQVEPLCRYLSRALHAFCESLVESMGRLQDCLFGLGAKHEVEAQIARLFRPVFAWGAGHALAPGLGL